MTPGLSDVDIIVFAAVRLLVRVRAANGRLSSCMTGVEGFATADMLTAKQLLNG
jgi:hypothetical protein